MGLSKVCGGILDGVHGKGKLRFRRRVHILVSFQQVAERDVEFFRTVGPSWVGVASQNEGLRYVTQRLFHRLVANLTAVPEDASSHPGGKGKEGLLLAGVREVPHVGIDAGFPCIAGPACPGRLSGRVIHGCRPNRCPRSVEITLDKRAEFGWAVVQDLDCGRGKDELKMVSNSWVGVLATQLANAWCLTRAVNRRDATSAKVLSVPATWNTAGGAARVVRWRMASPLSSRNAMGDSLLVAILVDQATAGELSHPITSWAWAMAGPTWSSSTR